MKTLPAINSLRFILAIWVLIFHTELPPILEGINEKNTFNHYLNKLYSLSFNGRAAVTIFFVISGLCIHYPYRNKNSFCIKAFYTRRLLRICIPIVFVWILIKILNLDYSSYYSAILWSLYAEIIYYILYPIFHFLGKTLTWKQLITMSLIPYTIVLLLFPEKKAIPNFPLEIAWIIGFPSWLAGCFLAEINFTNAKFKYHWLLLIRLFAWIFSVLITIIHFHWIKIPEVWTLTLFAFFSIYWIKCEIEWYMKHNVIKILEKAGLFSYSIYIFQKIPIYIIQEHWILPDLGFNMNWCFKMSFIIFSSYCFFRIIEKPSHQLARFLGSNFESKIL